MTDITPTWPGYSGPRIDLRWQNSVGVAEADDPRAKPWVLVPVELLRRLVNVANLADPGAVETAEDLLMRADSQMHWCEHCGWHKVMFGCEHEHPFVRCGDGPAYFDGEQNRCVRCDMSVGSDSSGRMVHDHTGLADCSGASPAA